MSRLTNTVLASALALTAWAAQAGERFPGIGRPATPAEVKAWDIDVRPDLKGLPKGSGTVARGQDLFEERCASCHGSFGESNEVFTPLVGGTTKDDIRTGRVAALVKGDAPQRTTLMKVATVSTLFDYIQRAMPWTSPKSLKPDEVYSILAYLLNLAEIIPDDFELSDRNLAEVQQRMPNRNGMTTAHGMWPGKGIPGTLAKPDVHNTACMKDCKPVAAISSRLPAYAETAHGNLAEQNRPYGAIRGKDTNNGQSAAAAPAVPAAQKLAGEAGCLACHGLTHKVVGPGFNEVAARYRGQADAAGRLAAKVKAGGAGAWGAIPMPAHPQIKDDDIRSLVQWVLESR